MANPIRPVFLDDPTMPDFAKALGEYMYTSQVSNHTQLTSIDSRLSDLTTSSQDNTRAISNLQAEVRSSRSVVDQCELRFSGVPDSSPLSDEEFAMKILTAMQCADRVGPLLSVRRWDFPPARPIPAQGTNPSASQLTPAGNFNPNEETYGQPLNIVNERFCSSYKTRHSLREIAHAGAAQNFRYSAAKGTRLQAVRFVSDYRNGAWFRLDTCILSLFLKITARRPIRSESDRQYNRTRSLYPPVLTDTSLQLHRTKASSNDPPPLKPEAHEVRILQPNLWVSAIPVPSKSLAHSRISLLAYPNNFTAPFSPSKLPQISAKSSPKFGAEKYGR
ncbi:hypothetical protein QAD02_012560 [Eretmocerus hayati]|uniref:Uncharacterized protein n=1 Tax=Eretmocerus hayati TaxID=131215 RepID=A0ACC2P0Z9_9HYME|nr:hypothetical protein QAD02_012560 [Eretmocerus hayati]